MSSDTPLLSGLPAGREFKLVWSDEFDGDRLDLTKWSFRTNFWGRRFPAFAGPDEGAVEVKDGKVHLKLIRRRDGQYASPQLQTGELMWDIPRDPNAKSFWPLPKREKPKFEHTFGYYECRCRLQQSPGWWSAFWMQSASQGVTLDPQRSGIEHDIMESFDPGEVFPAYFHYNGYGEDYKYFHIKRSGSSDDKAHLDKTAFHTFGLLWEPDGYTVYIDNVPSGSKRGTATGDPVSHAPQFILISTEPKWYRNDKMTGKGVPELKTAYETGDEFIVDYVRVYDIVK